jgi:hypothetical protein
MKEIRNECMRAIEEGRCLGCNALEMKEFEGKEECRYREGEWSKDWRIKR